MGFQENGKYHGRVNSPTTKHLIIFNRQEISSMCMFQLFFVAKLSVLVSTIVCLFKSRLGEECEKGRTQSAGFRFSEWGEFSLRERLEARCVEITRQIGRRFMVGAGSWSEVE
jgi:hypothetical protein